MADGFEVSPATLTTASEAVTRVAGDLRGKVSDISSTVGSGNPWGADEQGSVFGQLYTAVVSHAIETVGSHADQLDYASRSLAEWAKDHEQNDSTVSSRFAALGGGA